ncbi:mediator of RNA polymerase II transcription subunit 26-like [Lepisosteus oculatus]|uniref:mediator of RNA polymerase II transcription subunit 26-like n=1 Tax=Lepisosteus oculatus TaxID=7918 RepID=UPI0037238D21
MALISKETCSPQQMKELLLQSMDRDANVVNMEKVLEVLSMLENYPITREALEETRLGKYVNSLRKKTLKKELSKRAKKLVKSWQKIALIEESTPASVCADRKNSPVQQMTPGISGTPAEQHRFSSVVDPDKCNVPPSFTEMHILHHTAWVRVDEAAVDSPEVIPSPTSEPMGQSGHRHFVRQETGGFLEKGTLEWPQSPSSDNSSLQQRKLKSWARVIQEPGSLETFSPASCSTPPHSPVTATSDYSLVHRYAHSSSFLTIPPSQHPQRTSHFTQQHSAIVHKAASSSPVDILSTSTHPGAEGKSQALSPPSSVGEEQVETKPKSKRGRRKGGFKDVSVCLDGLPPEPGPGKIKERRITYDPLRRKIVVVTPKTSAPSKAEHESPLPKDTGSISELRERNLQIWDSMDKSDWKEFAKNKIIQKYFSSQCKRLTVSGLEPKEYIDHLQELLSQDSIASEGWQPCVIVPTEPASHLPGVSQEVSIEDLVQIHSQHWSGVNGCYDSKSNWYDWAQCISLEPYSNKEKLGILPYVCLD